MTRQIDFRTFRSPDDSGWSDAWRIYTVSFPCCERRTEADCARALADPAFAAEGAWCGGRLAGILFYWIGPGFHYVEHLAVDPELRGGSLGTAILSRLCGRAERVVLEIDPPEEEIALRRLHFYRRLGFRDNPYAYVHPSYACPFQPHRLVLMSWPGTLAPGDARRFDDFVRKRVLRYSEHGELDESLLK